MSMRFRFRIALGACGLVLLLATPAARAQVDFSTFVQLGDSLTAGYLDACWVEHGQRDSYGAIFARQVGTAFEQPLLKEPGLGSGGIGPKKGCLVLTRLLPTPAFDRKESVLIPLNLNLPRPYNNLGVPGYRIQDVTDAKTVADNGNPLTDIVLRNRPGTPQTTALQQAASLKPTFVTVFIGANDVLGAVGIATAIEGVTVTPMAIVNSRLQTIFDTLKAAQGGSGKGVAITLPNVTAIPFASTISASLTLNGKPLIDPTTGAPFTVLSRQVRKFFSQDTGIISTGILGDVAPVPGGSLLTLNAAPFLATGFGYPCRALDVAGAPQNDPRRANCNKPLPDDLDPATGIPGVVLFPLEVQALQARVAQINDAITTKASAAGFKVLDANALFSDIVTNGRDIGGVKITTSFLTGGFFSYDGVHPTSIGYAILANELIAFVNSNYGASIRPVNLFDFLANGNSQPGGFPAIPVGFAPLSNEQAIAYAADTFRTENWSSLGPLFGLFPKVEDVEHELDPVSPIRHLGR